MEREEIDKLSDKYYALKGFLLSPPASLIGVGISDGINKYFNFSSEAPMIYAWFFIPFFAYLLAFFVGMPLFFILYKIRKINFLTTTASGVAVGYLFSAGFIEDAPSPESLPFILAGLSASVVFWWLYTYRSSNKSLKPTASASA